MGIRLRQYEHQTFPILVNTVVVVAMIFVVTNIGIIMERCISLTLYISTFTFWSILNTYIYMKVQDVSYMAQYARFGNLC